MQNSKFKLHFAFRRNRAGVTLIELVISMGILGLVILGVTAFQRDFFSLNRFIGGGLSRETEVRKVMKQFSAEVRSASQSSTGGYTIETASAAEFAFFSDIDNDGLKERVRYFLSGGRLRRGVLKPAGQPLVYVPDDEELAVAVSDVTGPAAIFSYFDASYSGAGSPLAQPVNIPDIRLIRMELTVDPNGPKPPSAADYAIQAVPRNLRWQ